MNIKEGNRARCCVLGIGGTDEGTDGGKPSDGCTDGDGEGGRDMVVWDRTLPFDLRSKIKINTDVFRAASQTYQFVPSRSIIFQSTPSFLTYCPTISRLPNASVLLSSFTSSSFPGVPGKEVEALDVLDGDGGGNALDGRRAIGRREPATVIGVVFGDSDVCISLDWCGWGYLAKEC